MNPDPTVPLVAAVPGYAWRALRPDDIPALQQMLAAASDMDQTEGASEARLRQLLALLGDQVAANTRAAVAPDGTLAAAGMLFIRPTDEGLAALVDGNVAVDQRGRGLGRALLGWLEARAREALGPRKDGEAPLLRTSCRGHQADRAALFDACGFRPVRYSYQMRRSLAQPILDEPLPAGLQWVAWTPELDVPLMDAFNAAFAGHYGVPRMDLETWRESFTGVPQFRGDLTYLVLAGGEIVGFCVNWVEAEDDQEGWVEAIGVIPAWRGRGVASALLVHSLRLFQAEGLARAALDVDAQNPTGALRLYEKHGFEVARETIHFGKPLGGE
jgi:mycothiol synthase